MSQTREEYENAFFAAMERQFENFTVWLMEHFDHDVSALRAEGLACLWITCEPCRDRYTFGLSQNQTEAVLAAALPTLLEKMDREHIDA